MTKFLTAIAVLLFTTGLALAQQEPLPKPQDLKKDDPVPPATDQNKSEQGGKQEPSAKSAGTDGNPAAFANGKLTAPGAPVDVDTAPAKFSSRSATDDQLPTAAYRLRHLSAEQRNGIYSEIAKAAKTNPASPNGQAVIGAAVPLDIILSGLQPLPDSITTRFPELNGLAFTTLAGKPALVDPTMRIVADVAAP